MTSRLVLAPFFVYPVFVSLIVITGISNTFNLLLINPLINALIILNKAVFGQFGVAIILFTLLLRLATVRHDNTFLIEMPGKADVHGARRGQGSRMFLKCPTMRA